MLLSSQLIKISPNLTVERAENLTGLINAGIKKYDLPEGALPEFLANIVHESGGFRIRKESLNYTRAERLVAVWPTRFGPGKRDPKQYVNSPAKLANFVYGGRMGNVMPYDGAAFVGGGFAQITGRDAYTMYHRWAKRAGTIQDTAKFVQETDEGAMDSAFWFFCVFKDLEQLALQDGFKELVKKWNGGWVGLQERQRLYNIAKEVLKQ